MFLALAVLSIIGLSVQGAAAQITEIRVDQIDNSAGGAPLDGFVTNDVYISFDGRYSGSQLLILLDEGTIYQDPDGGNKTPDSFPTPSSEFDSFVAQGLPTIGVINADFNGTILGAVNLGGAHPGAFDESLVNIAWHPALPPLPPDPPTGAQFLEDLSNLLTARITLSDDASGSWAYLASAQLEITIENRIIQGGVVSNGALVLPAVIPEPGTCSLAAIAVGALLCTWRRKQSA